jgi:hypothetical protein
MPVAFVAGGFNELASIILPFKHRRRCEEPNLTAETSVTTN